MKKSLVVLGVVTILTTLSACSMDGPSAPVSGGDGTIDLAATANGESITLTAAQEDAVKKVSDGKLIGIVCLTMSNEYHKILCEGAKDRAEELGFRAEIFDSQEDANRELQGVEGFISKGAVAILEDSLGGDAITAQMELAASKGITVVQLANRSFASTGAITVAVSNEDIATAEGTAAGEYAAAHYGGAEVQAVMLDYPDIPALVERADMIQDAFTAAYPQVTFVERALGATAENGYASLETLVQKYPGLDAVVGINDAGNLGAYQALTAAGFEEGDAYLFGIDCDPQAVDLIDSGTMYKGCVDTNPSGTGEIGVNAFALFLIGEKVPATIEVPVSVYNG
jgi:ribose transport system substrate-binding protein